MAIIGKYEKKRTGGPDLKDAYLNIKVLRLSDGDESELKYSAHVYADKEARDKGLEEEDCINFRFQIDKEEDLSIWKMAYRDLKSKEEFKKFKDV